MRLSGRVSPRLARREAQAQGAPQVVRDPTPDFFNAQGLGRRVGSLLLLLLVLLSLTPLLLSVRTLF